VAGCSKPLDDTTAVARGATRANVASPSRLLYVWAWDLDHRGGDSDFLATLDADPESPGYGSILHTTPIGSVGNHLHHAEPVAPTEGLLFANGFHTGRTFLFDLSDSSSPKLEGELAAVPGLTFPHDFRRLASGDVLVTMQRGDGSAEGDPGGLASFDSRGRLIRSSSAADPGFPGAKLRPYSLEVVPGADRVLTTGRSMFFREERAADVVQIWRLSDLSLLATLPVPRVPPEREPECILGVGDTCPAEHYAAEGQPFEIRALPDGSALLNTFHCGFYRIRDLASDAPVIEPVLSWPDLIGCSIPVLAGRIEVMPVMFANRIVSLDVAQPTSPRVVSTYQGTAGFSPHWVAADPRGGRIVVTTDGPGAAPTVAIFGLDAATGELQLDERFGSTDDSIPGFSFDLDAWPHGETGPAMPHAALFGAASGRAVSEHSPSEHSPSIGPDPVLRRDS
jgi:hypothetical protein